MKDYMSAKNTILLLLKAESIPNIEPIDSYILNNTMGIFIKKYYDKLNTNKKCNKILTDIEKFILCYVGNDFVEN